jgi:hypothetical protein
MWCPSVVEGWKYLDLWVDFVSYGIGEESNARDKMKPKVSTMARKREEKNVMLFHSTRHSNIFKDLCGNDKSNIKWKWSYESAYQYPQNRECIQHV